jgi:hypothetical protein
MNGWMNLHAAKQPLAYLLSIGLVLRYRTIFAMQSHFWLVVCNVFIYYFVMFLSGYAVFQISAGWVRQGLSFQWRSVHQWTQRYHQQPSPLCRYAVLQCQDRHCEVLDAVTVTADNPPVLWRHSKHILCTPKFQTQFPPFYCHGVLSLFETSGTASFYTRWTSDDLMWWTAHWYLVFSDNLVLHITNLYLSI